MIDIFSLFENETIALLIKVLTLIFIGLYIIMAFIIINHIRTLNKIVYFEKSSLSRTLVIVSYSYFVLTASLFFLALVIL